MPDDELNRPLRPMRNAMALGRVPLEQGGEALILILRRDAFVELPDGPHPGLTILPDEARRLVDTIQRLLAEMEAGLPPGDGFEGF